MTGGALIAERRRVHLHRYRVISLLVMLAAGFVADVVDDVGLNFAIVYELTHDKPPRYC